MVRGDAKAIQRQEYSTVALSLNAVLMGVDCHP